MGLGVFPWARIKRKISYNPWRMTSREIVIKIALCKFKWSITKRSCLKLAVHCGDNGPMKMSGRVAHP